MCIIFFAIEKHPDYPLILIANRDEFFARPAAPAHFDEEGPGPAVLAGRDLQKGGTWLGITKNGRFAAITNYRAPKPTVVPGTSRGQLALDFLKSTDSPMEYLGKIAARGTEYEGFNLLVADRCNFAYYSNANKDPPVALNHNQVYGLSNSFLETPWPKLTRGKTLLSEYINNLCRLPNTQCENTQQKDSNTKNNDKSENSQKSSRDLIDLNQLLTILRDDVKPPASELPNTGIGEPLETLLSSIFVTTPNHYGTRCSTIYLIDAKNRVTFYERTYNEDNTSTDVKFEFELEPK